LDFGREKKSGWNFPNNKKSTRAGAEMARDALFSALLLNAAFGHAIVALNEISRKSGKRGARTTFLFDYTNGPTKKMSF
jgi:hypothetical protein